MIGKAQKVEATLYFCNTPLSALDEVQVYVLQLKR